jgi:hypothetical protein
VWQGWRADGVLPASISVAWLEMRARRITGANWLGVAL